MASVLQIIQDLGRNPCGNCVCGHQQWWYWGLSQSADPEGPKGCETTCYLRWEQSTCETVILIFTKEDNSWADREVNEGSGRAARPGLLLAGAPPRLPVWPLTPAKSLHTSASGQTRLPSWNSTLGFYNTNFREELERSSPEWRVWCWQPGGAPVTQTQGRRQDSHPDSAFLRQYGAGCIEF